MGSRVAAMIGLAGLIIGLMAHIGFADDVITIYKESDFNFKKGETTTKHANKACSEIATPCFVENCQKVFPGFVPPNDTTIRVSVKRFAKKDYGKCVDYAGIECAEIDGVPCAVLDFYGLAACAGTASRHTIYKNPGCTPKNSVPE